MIKKVLGGIGAALCVILLGLVAARVITWRIFWLGIIVLAALAYIVLPYLTEQD